MAWADATAYSEAVQNPRLAFRDAELHDGELATNRLGLPLIHSGNFAAVFQMRRPAGPPDWALKCFTRQVHGLRHRYQQIDAHLNGRRLPFMVDFAYQDEGILIGQQRYPLLKMDWVQGLRLDQFLEQRLGQPGAKRVLRELSRMWLRLSEMLRESEIAHGDLQHGNVMLVPVPGTDNLALKLIDYDGMYVPELAGHPPGEIGHPAYQHPSRTSKTGYGPTVDRFSHLVIYTTMQALVVGGRELWDRFYNGDRLLLGPDDFRDPENSDAFRTLWQIDDPDVRALTGHLGLAVTEPIERVPLLSDLVTDSGVIPLTDEQQARVRGMFQPLPIEVGEAKPETSRDVVAAEQGTVAEEPSLKDETDPAAVPRIAGSSIAQRVAGVRPTKRGWAGRLISGADRVLVRVVGEENTILLAVLRPLAAVFGFALALVLLITFFQAGLVSWPVAVELASRWSASPVPLEATEEPAVFQAPIMAQEAMPPEIAPAVYRVRVVPAEALLTASGMGVTIESVGLERIVTVESPEAEAKLVLLAMLDGFESARRELQPESGALEELEIQLVRIAEPAVYRVHVTPGNAELTVIGSAVTVSGTGSQRTVTVAEPDGEMEIILLAVLEGYEELRIGLEPIPGQMDELRIELLRIVQPAVYRVTLNPGEAELRPEGAGASITGTGRQRTVTVAKPDDETEIELVASLSGYEDERVKLQPVSGESRDVLITLLGSTITNSIGMRFRLIPVGEFLMGSPDSDRAAQSAEKPQHRVRIAQRFYLGVCPVTQLQWRRVMGSNRSRFKGPDHPVETVSWEDCQEFIRRLSDLPAERDGLYRLPTEAEWEYACRAGSTTVYSFGDSAASLGDYAWYSGNSGGSTHPVGQKKPNAWGLYDMHGNVWEWCQDRYDRGYYASSPIDDPTGPTSGSYRVFRGGGWFSFAGGCRSAYRGRGTPDDRDSDLGFRLAFSSVDALDAKAETPSPPKTAIPSDPRAAASSKTPPQPVADTPKATAPPLAVAPFDATAAKTHQQAWSRYIGQPVEVTNSIGMKLVLIPPGEFMMGSTVSAAEIHRRFPGGQVEYYEREHPPHKVRITRPYYLGTHEVSVADFERFITATGYRTTAEKEGKSWKYQDDREWKEVAGLNWRKPGFDQQSTHPVTCVSWDDAMAFCQWLSGEDGRAYRLPTEAEWEYACRAGTDTLFFWGDDPDAGEGYLNAADETGTLDGRSLAHKFNFKDGYAATSPVGRFKPNAFGLHDMLGNVWEWCSDWYDSYASTSVDDPTGRRAGSGRVVRGGGWISYQGACRSAVRFDFSPGYRFYSLGFRLASSSVDQPGQ